MASNLGTPVPVKQPPKVSPPATKRGKRRRAAPKKESFTKRVLRRLKGLAKGIPNRRARRLANRGLNKLAKSYGSWVKGRKKSARSLGQKMRAANRQARKRRRGQRFPGARGGGSGSGFPRVKLFRSPSLRMPRLHFGLPSAPGFPKLGVGGMAGLVRKAMRDLTKRKKQSARNHGYTGVRKRNKTGRAGR